MSALSGVSPVAPSGRRAVGRTGAPAARKQYADGVSSGRRGARLGMARRATRFARETALRLGRVRHPRRAYSLQAVRHWSIERPPWCQAWHGRLLASLMRPPYVLGEFGIRVGRTRRRQYANGVSSGRCGARLGMDPAGCSLALRVAGVPRQPYRPPMGRVWNCPLPGAKRAAMDISTRVATAIASQLRRRSAVCWRSRPARNGAVAAIR